MADNYEFFYSGGTSSLDPGYGDLFTGYRTPISKLGAPTSINTADQIREVSSRLNEGIKNVEMGSIDPTIFDTIPKQHMQEINRLSKLAGTETSVHAPIIDPAGFTREGWSEGGRESAERQILDVVMRSHELNPKGNIPITIHASGGIPGTEYKAPKEGLPGGEVDVMWAVNQETGEMLPSRRMKKYLPEGGGKEEIIPAQEGIGMTNRGMWQSQITSLQQNKKLADDLIIPSLADLKALREKQNQGQELTPEEKDRMAMDAGRIERGYSFLQNTSAVIRNCFNEAYKYSDKNKKTTLKDAGIDYTEAMATAYDNKGLDSIKDAGDAVDKMIKELSKAEPKIYKPIEEFAIDKASKTFGNVAYKSYKKFEESAPVINIENVPIGGAISRAEDMKKLIEASRKEFVAEAVKDGMSEDSAKRQAEKLIGATWDVGHINLLRKGGFKKEDIVKETKEIAPYVKHVHLTDNFGYSDTHLPIGMGEVPVKEMMKELEKAGYSGKQIVEAGGFAAQFKTSPTQYVLEAMGSPLYSAQMQPYWNQIRGGYGNYFGGYGTILPEQHFSMYGGGFSTLPVDLGGQMSNKQSRFSGTPNE